MLVLITDKLRPDLVALLLRVVLGLTGLVGPKDLLSGFSPARLPPAGKNAVDYATA